MVCGCCKCSFCRCCRNNGALLEDEEKKTNEPLNTNIRQQRVGGYGKGENWIDDTFSCRYCSEKNISTEKKLGYLIFFPIMMVSFTLGITLIGYENPIILDRRYDDLGCTLCILRIDLDEDMQAPIYFNYGLVNFYQNHRVYVNSKSDQQLKGSILNTQNCNPLRNLDGLAIYPCGLLPQSIFTDRFFIDVERDGNITRLCPADSCPRDEADITWENYWDLWDTDGTWERTGTWGGLADSKFGVPDVFPSGGYTRQSPFLNETNLLHGTNFHLPLANNSDFIVWLRTAKSSTFKKPFRVNREYDFKKDDILHIRVYNFFNPGEKGEKHFYIETAQGFGSTTLLLGALCIGIGMFSCCMCLFVLSGFKHRPLLSEENM